MTNKVRTDKSLWDQSDQGVTVGVALPAVSKSVKLSGDGSRLAEADPVTAGRQFFGEGL